MCFSESMTLRIKSDYLQGNEILEDIDVEANAHTKSMSKKAKQTLKHEFFLKRMPFFLSYSSAVTHLSLDFESSRSPYSKSHERRMKRKAREQVAGGLTDMHAAITALEAAEIPADLPVVGKSEAPNEDFAKGPTTRSGQIGESKGVTPTKSQRKRAL